MLIVMESKGRNHLRNMLGSVEEILASGTCSGCGACAVAEPTSYTMDKGANGIFLPTTIKSDSKVNAARVCPFSSKLLVDRKSIGAAKAGPSRNTQNLLGSYVYLGAGRILSDEVWSSSSGGLTTWLLCQLLENGLVDGVIHLGNGSSSSSLFEYSVSRSVSEVHSKRGSKYFASTFQEVMERVRMDGLTYAFVGVPCFINAVDLLRVDSEDWRKKIAITIGLVCGHLKSQVFTEALSWQLGVAPQEIAEVNFRLKDPNSKSSDYSFAVKSKTSGKWVSRRVNSLLGANWGQSAFALDSCNSCTDLFGYTSDVTMGDAWLDRYEKESRGTNIIVVRNPVIERIFSSGQQSKQIFLEELEGDQVLESQLGGIRHRVEGYLIRKSKSFRTESPQSDFSPEVPPQKARRRLLVRYRAFISHSTSKHTHLLDRKSYVRWSWQFRLMAFIYNLLDVLARFTWKKFLSKVKISLRIR